MVSIATLSPNLGSQKTRKRVGRGNGSGMGTFSGRGVKGQGARTGKGKFNAAFEGGQTPLFRRLPKARGFTQWKQVFFNIVNLSQIQALADKGITTIDSFVLAENGIIRGNGQPLKVLANGNVTSAVTITATKASKEALAKIEKAGGTVQFV